MDKDSSSALSALPLWVKVILGFLIVLIIYLLAFRLNPYLATWDEESPTFYQNANEGLRLFGIQPSAPTAFVFWDKENEDSAPALRAFQTSPANLRVYGIHLSTSTDKLAIRRKWSKYAPRRASLLFDRSQLLETSFRVRSVPTVYIYLPKQKKIFSLFGDIRENRERMLEIIDSE